jgi:hypothetical protein
VPGGSYPRSPMHVEPDVALVGPDRFPRVQPHPHAHRAVRKRELRIGRGGHSIGRTRKGDEERVALRVDLDTLVAQPCRSQRTAVLGKHFRIPIAQLPEQPRRTLDVREEERHRPGRELWLHLTILSCPRPRDYRAPA